MDPLELLYNFIFDRKQSLLLHDCNGFSIKTPTFDRHENLDFLV